MQQKKAEYTLWTIPNADWNKLFNGERLSDEYVAELKLVLEAELKPAAKKLDEKKLKNRLTPFNTPVTAGTLSKLID